MRFAGGMMINEQRYDVSEKKRSLVLSSWSINLYYRTSYSTDLYTYTGKFSRPIVYNQYRFCFVKVHVKVKLTNLLISITNKKKTLDIQYLYA